MYALSSETGGEQSVRCVECSAELRFCPGLGISESMRRQCARGFVRLKDQLAIADFPRNGNNLNHDTGIKSNKYTL